MEAELQELQNLYSQIPQQLMVRIYSHSTQYPLAQTQLQVSSELDQSALNQLLAELLGRQDLPFFEFLAAGHMLRGKLKSHILRHQLTAQQTLDIQYLLGFPSLNEQAQVQDDDWIAAIATLPIPNGLPHIATALYSGKVSLFTPQLQKIHTFQTDEHPLKAVQFMPASKQNTYYCLSGGLGQTLSVWLVELNNGKCQTVQIGSSMHDGSVSAIGVSPGVDGHVISGGESGILKLWQIQQGFDQGSNLVKSGKKKKEVLKKEIPLLNSYQIQGSIECLSWLSNEEVITGQSNHKMQITNITKMTSDEQILTRDSVVTSIDSAGNSILSAHEDGQIRLWDRRQSSRPASTFKTHSKWASSVKFNASSFVFASSSYDQTVKVWDTRCGFPLQNMLGAEQKVLDVQWLSSDILLSGGSSGRLLLHGAQNGGK